MWIVGNRSGILIATLFAAALMTAVGCTGGREEGPGVAPDPTVSAVASSPAPTEPGPDPTATADAPTPTPTTATEAPTPAPTAAPDTPTTAPTAGPDAPTPAPTAATDTPTPAPAATDTPTPAPAATDVPTPFPTATNAPIPTATAAPASSSAKGDHGFGAALTVDGDSYEMWCPEEKGNPNVRLNPRNWLSFTCSRFYTTLMLVIQEDVTTLDGPFESTAQEVVSVGGTKMSPIGFAIVGEATGKVLVDTGQGNLKAAKLSGPYDGGTGRVVGTFEAEFSASKDPKEREGLISGSFDLAITW